MSSRVFKAVNGSRGSTQPDGTTIARTTRANEERNEEDIDARGLITFIIFVFVPLLCIRFFPIVYLLLPLYLFICLCFVLILICFVCFFVFFVSKLDV